ncbi:aldehyde dehydrogenase domain-containing protein [Zychaea mexicana]|uniref:aldehyde dehydrogenase domain-containing protein n=1 Tax=Zychaea mexicana TaxID=64656 RepID=UPI0022FE562B|nr:aldehyde dehydrogenase domain-containing protein [Zychaea mexicana]KAI9492127.1 aldehyde dehydrogenase domain-containing protein [Zychaea mexicana]
MSNFVTEYTTPSGFKLNLNTALFINNEFVAGGSTIDTINPVNGEVIATVQAAEKEQVDLAVEAAEKAFYGGWKKSTGRERARLMNKLADLCERDAEELAQIETLDNGKPLTNSRMVDVQIIVTQLRYFAGWCDKIHGKVIETEGKLSYTVHEPIGVCGGIIPWNLPMGMLSWKIAPAVATGNTVVIKTSELTPLSAIKVAALVKEAGFPPGVINIITGYGHITGDALARHMKVSKIAFTGSLAIGRQIMRASADSNLKKVTLELGGKSPNIVFDDVENLDEVVFWSRMGIFFNAGQACCAGSRIFVQEGIYDKFVEKFKALAASGKVGDPLEADTFQGPQISQRQFDRVMDYIKAGKEEGATCLLGGNRVGDTGYFIEPTIFTDVTPKMKIMQEEIFGPVVCISKFTDIDDVVKKAHDTIYGLAAAVFTSNITRAVTLSNELEAGTVWVNCYNIINENSPFGGYKQSGQGRENSEYALANYTQVKAIKINVGNPL